MYSIMIVENEEKWRQLLAEGLTAKGYHVRAVQSWQEADAQLEGNGHFDVIVLNLHLLMKTDYLAEKVLESVVRYCPRTPCIILSGCPDEIMGTLGRYRYQVFELLWKGGDPQGFDLNRLCRTIDRAVLARSQVTQCNRRELLDILDRHLLLEDLEDIRLDLASRHRHPAFRASGNLQGATKRAKLQYMVQVLDTFGPEAVCDLCTVVKTITKAQGNVHLEAALLNVCSKD
jgi:response regulator RpfG family c-di-GMP phosphodiesterase